MYLVEDWAIVFPDPGKIILPSCSPSDRFLWRRCTIQESTIIGRYNCPVRYTEKICPLASICNTYIKAGMPAPNATLYFVSEKTQEERKHMPPINRCRQSSPPFSAKSSVSAVVGAIILLAGGVVMYVLGILLFERKDLYI